MLARMTQESVMARAHPAICILCMETSSLYCRFASKSNETSAPSGMSKASSTSIAPGSAPAVRAASQWSCGSASELSIAKTRLGSTCKTVESPNPASSPVCSAVSSFKSEVSLRPPTCRPQSVLRCGSHSDAPSSLRCRGCRPSSCTWASQNCTYSSNMRVCMCACV